jgi:hypothetical protein
VARMACNSRLANGALACSVITDQDGNAATWLTAAAAGTAIVTARLAPGVYSPAKSVSRHAERHAIVL